jgi:hypothetical protein
VGTRDNGLKDQRRRSSASRKRFGAVHASEKLMSAEWSRPHENYTLRTILNDCAR